MKSSSFEAADSSLGFYFQSAYSLVLLCQSSDDAVVSVETIDDVQLQDGRAPVLAQLKHSTGKLPALNEKSDGLWKTIGNWISIDDWSKYIFMYVTCADLKDGSDLVALSHTATDRDIVKALECLRSEARRVVESPTVDQAKEKGSSGFNYKTRRPACQAFLDLGAAKQELLVRKLTLVTSSFNAGDVEAELKARLLQTELQRSRTTVAERLIEWWDRRVAKALLGQLPRQISKTELLERLAEIRVDVTACRLTDFYGNKSPDDFSSELGGNMERQIQLVDGGTHRIKRAARERWRARKNRDRWMDESLAFAAELEDYDKLLIQEWHDRHAPMSHDTRELTEREQKIRGLEILDWSHNTAHNEVRAFKTGLDVPSLIRGTYQQLAEELLVGWHPDYMNLCTEIKAETGMRWHDDEER